MAHPLRTGYVWKLHSGAFLVLFYGGKRTKVSVALVDTDSEMTACRLLADRYPNHAFNVANRDEKAWGNVVHRAQYATMIM
jgi:hypothetical protein